MRSTLEPIKKVAKSLRRHRNLILNWFQAKGTISAGDVEGLNGVVKLTTRKAFGFRTAKGIEIALFHGLGPASRARINPQILLRRHTRNALEGLLGLYGSLDRSAGSIDSIPLPRQTRTLPGSSMTSAVPASPPLMAASVV